jgi:hypothetical protein
VVDTRLPAGPFGGPALSGGADRTFALAGVCGIPGGARAISINVTIAQPTTAGDLRFFPAGAALPNASVINFAANQVRANNAVVAVSSATALAVHDDQPANAAVHLILDVNGYFQ